MLILFAWVTFFAQMACILGANQGDAEGYSMILAAGYFLTTFENGLGNISNPTIAFVKDEKVLDKVLG